MSDPSHTQENPPDTASHQYQSDSAKECWYILNDWLQDTRLSNEAIYRLVKDGNYCNGVTFSCEAWPKAKGTQSFSMKPKQLQERLKLLQENYWYGQFVFLESIWEGYLENLFLEIAKKLPEVLNDFCISSPSPDVMIALFDKSADVKDLRQQAAEFFASQLTRMSWSVQWKQLEKLSIGLSASKCQKEKWWKKLDIYFEMRNCIIHRQRYASSSLREKDPKTQDKIRLTPDELEYFRIQFLNAVTEIDRALIGRLSKS